MTETIRWVLSSNLLITIFLPSPHHLFLLENESGITSLPLYLFDCANYQNQCHFKTYGMRLTITFQPTKNLEKP